MIFYFIHLNVEEFAGREAEEIAAEMGVTQMNIVVFVVNSGMELVGSMKRSPTDFGITTGTRHREVETLVG